MFIRGANEEEELMEDETQKEWTGAGVPCSRECKLLRQTPKTAFSLSSEYLHKITNFNIWRVRRFRGGCFLIFRQKKNTLSQPFDQFIVVSSRLPWDSNQHSLGRLNWSPEHYLPTPTDGRDPIFSAGTFFLLFFSSSLAFQSGKCGIALFPLCNVCRLQQSWIRLCEIV